MKIGIVGNYGNNNNGDEAILAGIIEQLKDHYHISARDIVVFSNNPPQTSNRYGVEAYPLYYKRSSAKLTFLETVKKNSPLIRELDFLIVGGGGILMDFYNREAQLYGSYGMMAKWAKVPYIVYGCGAGPITSTIGKWFIRKLCTDAQSVSVRDPASKKLLHKIGVKKDILIIGDPSFALPSSKKIWPDESIKYIGVTVVPYYSLSYWPEANDIKYDNYVQSMADNLDLLTSEREVFVTLFSTKFPHDVDVTVDVFNRMKNKQSVKVVKDHLSPEELIAISSEQDVVIGTRLHSLYLAANAQTPIIGISYHHKVNDFMKMVDISDRCIRIEDLINDQTVINKVVCKLESDWEHIKISANELSISLKGNASKGIVQFLDLKRDDE